MEKFHERLKHVLKVKGFTVTELVIKTQKSPGTINNYRNGHYFPDYAFFQSIKDLIPELNGNWLLYGEGEMFLNETNDGNTTDEKKSEIVENEQTAVLQQKVAKFETFVNSMNEQFSEIKQMAMQGLEKLRGVAVVRLVKFCNQFVNTQNLQLCK